MANTEYYKGQTVDPDENGNFIKIEGKKYYYKLEEGQFVYSPESENIQAIKNKLRNPNLINLGHAIINMSPTTEILETERKKHIKILEGGTKTWNEWRVRKPYIRPILYDLGRDKIESSYINFQELKNINFSNANLINADLTNANLANANFHEANLGGAILHKANLREANFCRTDFYKSDLSGADLTEANLQGAQIAGTKFGKVGKYRTKIIRSKVYGSSAWDIDLSETIQEELEIVYRKENGEQEYTNLIVDDLRMAQFIYFILNNKNLFNVFNATHSSVVLLLGRFTKERKIVLDKLRIGIRDKVSSKKYVPILFDFEKNESHGYIETITVLAGISRFVIADLSEPKSIPKELQAIVERFRTPIIPIFKTPENSAEPLPYSMFVDNLKYDWVHPVISYASNETLFENFEKLISIGEELHEKIRKETFEDKRKLIPIDKI